MGRLAFSFLIIGVLLTGVENGARGEGDSYPSPAYVFPTDPYYFQPGSGQEIASIYCLICHSADYIYMQPSHSEEKWTAIVKKMKKVMGCPIPDEQIPLLGSYLFHQNSVSPNLAGPMP